MEHPSRGNTSGRKAKRLRVDHELWKRLQHERAETGRPVEHLAHDYLCRAMGEPERIGHPVFA